ncbi:MAG: pyridoxal-phosphate dependent enzyme [Candidatus Hydrogenedentota bacterium]|uniref:Threonine synthase n=1 Tax=Sumerlaea chitinivorans TaxID=2250252 RepID=A0A2Z4Y4H9_SUMC1|nr:Threonine synthase [Candidatus Sumerlaea chitinivorans]RMH28775.1 MAG: pyridoxal-phosphate dependent enzyme [Candidatus Hydrogenedentota bacterium]
MTPMVEAYLFGLRSGRRYDLAHLHEFGDNGELLEVRADAEVRNQLRAGRSVYERFSDFWNIAPLDLSLSLGEGNTPLLSAGRRLSRWVGANRLLLKNETVNPTWSFKDRGTFACAAHARACGENYLATISTGNMGHSVAAYAARAGMRAIIIVPAGTSPAKISPMAAHGAYVLEVECDNFSTLKHGALEIASELGIRMVSGNGPIRAEGYKFEAFEMWEQFGAGVPDYVVVPTSACGHIRGIFKGWLELRQHGFCRAIPTMIVAQPARIAPIAAAIGAGTYEPVVFPPATTVAEALSSGDPPGAAEILQMAREYGWLAETADEEEILEARAQLAADGFFVEASAAVGIAVLRKLIAQGKLDAAATIVAVLTGSGLKEHAAQSQRPVGLVYRAPLKELKDALIRLVDPLASRQVRP